MVCIVRSARPQPRWSPTGQKFCSILSSVQNFLSAFPLNPEKWSDLIYSGMPCVSVYELMNFTVHFPLLDLIIITDGNFENIFLATRM